MVLKVADMVAESCSSPGTGTFSLAGALTGRVPFSAAFSNGATCYYYATDGTNFECGVGTLTYGTPNSLARTTVINTSAGSTTKINFSGTVTVYCDVPAAKTVSLDLFVQASASGSAALKLPSGEIMSRGYGTSDINGLYTATFQIPYAGPPVPMAICAGVGNPDTSKIGVNNVGTTNVIFYCSKADGSPAPGQGFYWTAIG